MLQAFKQTREAIGEAHDPDRVAKLVHNCMAVEVSVDLKRSLPLAAQLVLDDNDRGIPEAAVDLLRCELHYAGPPEAAELLHEIAQTYAVAAAQISRIKNGR